MLGFGLTSRYILLYQNKKRKAQFCYTEAYALPNLVKLVPGLKNWANRILLFPEKEAKSVVVLLPRKLWAGHPNLGEADPGGFGERAPPNI
jgi:hypothetical protein